MARNTCERLEGRLLLSAAGPTLNLAGTGGNDVIRLQIEAGVGSVQYNLVYTLNGTQFLYDDSTFGAINLNTLGGNDQVTVDGIRDHALTINLGSGADSVQVNYGTNSSPNNQLGILPFTPIQVNGGGGVDSLTFNGQRDGAANQYMIGTSSVVAGAIDSGGQSSIDTLTYSGIQNLTVVTSQMAGSPNVVNVTGTSIPTAINTVAGDVINVTPVGQNLDAVQGPITIDGSHATLNVDDQGDSNTDFTTYSVTGTQLMRVGEGLSYVNGLPLVTVNSTTINYSGIGSVQLNAGAYTNVVQVLGTSAGMPVTVNPGTGTVEIDADQTDPTSPVIIGPGGNGEAVRVNANRAGSAHVLFDAPQTIGALTIGANGVAEIAPGGSNALTVSSLVIPDTGKIDVANDLLQIQYAPGQGPTTNAMVAGMIFLGTIYSSTANPGQSIGYQDNTATQTELIQLSGGPTVASLSPASGPLAGGSSVVITGTNFSGATGVTFGGTAATSFTIDSPTQITAVDPAGNAGVVDVQVTTASGGTSATGTSDKFTYVSPVPTPTIVGSPVVNGDNPNGLMAGVQRSMVEDVVYTFSSAVTIPNANAAFTVTGAGPNPGTAPTTLTATAVPGSNGTQWAVTLTGGAAGVLGSVANGEYSITINPSAVFAAADGTTQLAAGQTDQFYRLFGDINGDGVVNAVDGQKFRKALTIYNPAFDSNADGIVNAVDNLAFKKDRTVAYFDDGFISTI